MTDRDQEHHDWELLERIRDGHQDAAYALYARYAEPLIRVARGQTAHELRTRFDPEDVVQSVFRTFFRRVSNGQYVVPEGSELWKLLLVMALNKLRTLGAHHRAEKRDVRRTGTLNVVFGDGTTQASDAEALQQLQWSIDEVLHDYPEVQQQIIRMRIEGEEVQAIADATSRSKRTVERVLQQFRDALLARLSDIVTQEPTSDE